MAAFPEMLAQDRKRSGFTVGQVAWRLGVSLATYRELEAGSRSPTFETWGRICQVVRVAADVRRSVGHMTAE